MTVDSERRASFEALFSAHNREVRAYALRRGAGPSADDVVAETFLVAWRRLEVIGEDPLPWLLGVARRVLSNQQRGERRRLALIERLPRVTRPVELAPPGLLDESLSRALTRLSRGEREALLLVAWEGLSSERAARAAGCSVSTFRVRLHRARRRIRQVLDNDERGRGTAAVTTTAERMP